MPWASVQQARWGHSLTGVRALGGKNKVSEWDAATPKGSLPDKAPPKRGVLGMALMQRKGGSRG